MAPKRGSMMAGNQVETGTCLSDVESCNMISIDVSDEIGRASFCWGSSVGGRKQALVAARQIHAYYQYDWLSCHNPPSRIFLANKHHTDC